VRLIHLPIFNKKYLEYYKKTINWESLIQNTQVLYTKFSHIHRLTTPPNLQFCLSSSKREQLTCPQVVKHAVFMYKGVCIKIYWLHDEKDEAMCTYHLFFTEYAARQIGEQNVNYTVGWS